MIRHISRDHLKYLFFFISCIFQRLFFPNTLHVQQGWVLRDDVTNHMTTFKRTLCFYLAYFEV